MSTVPCAVKPELSIDTVFFCEELYPEMLLRWKSTSSKASLTVWSTGSLLLGALSYSKRHWEDTIQEGWNPEPSHASMQSILSISPATTNTFFISVGTQKGCSGSHGAPPSNH